MRLAALVPIASLIGACGTETLAFETPDAADGTDAGAEARAAVTGCSSDVDCALSGLHCDPSSQQCVACVTSDQCAGPDLTVCDSALNMCVECGVDGDCHGGTCEPTSHRCIPSCSDGGSCPSGLLCLRSGACVECTNDAFCAGNRIETVCDPTIGQCVQCVDDSDCPQDRPECDRTIGRCVQCLDATSCRPGDACDPQQHVCVDVRPSSPDAAPPPGTDFDAGLHAPI